MKYYSSRLIFLLGFVFLATNLIADDSKMSTYTVKKGDTLWDISKQEYNNPWYWPGIWNVNKAQIINPNLIYPNQVLNIPDKSLLNLSKTELSNVKDINQENITEQTEDKNIEKQELEQAKDTDVEKNNDNSNIDSEDVEEVGLSEQKENQDIVYNKDMIDKYVSKKETQGCNPDLDKTQFENTKLDDNTNQSKKTFLDAKSFIAPLDWTPDGKIVGDRDKKILIATNDIVYVDLNRYKVSPGTNCTVYRIIDKVEDPSTNRIAGYEVHKIAKIQITRDVGDVISCAKVLVSYDTINIGDVVVIDTDK